MGMGQLKPSITDVLHILTGLETHRVPPFPAQVFGRLLKKTKIANLPKYHALFEPLNSQHLIEMMRSVQTLLVKVFSSSFAATTRFKLGCAYI